ncbi:MAG: hypothetical protein D3903_02020 [Candidatus Electrothrix sp. GM3_4]|nr:hypothetical protein [Candidatus Electrothrix sp. GM3_4]
MDVLSDAVSEDEIFLTFSGKELARSPFGETYRQLSHVIGKFKRKPGGVLFFGLAESNETGEVGIRTCDTEMLVYCPATAIFYLLFKISMFFSRY